MLLRLLFLNLYPLIGLAVSAPNLGPIQPSPDNSVELRTEPLATFIVSDFEAFIPNRSPDTSSHARFRLKDPRSNHAIEVECSISGKIYRPLYSACGTGAEGARFRLSEGELVIQRGWMMSGGPYIQTYAPQGTYWREGEGGNVTITQTGRTYTRTSEWHFPVQSASIVG